MTRPRGVMTRPEGVMTGPEGVMTGPGGVMTRAKVANRRVTGKWVFCAARARRRAENAPLGVVTPSG